ncbi:MAG: RND family transporter [Acidobacteriota bacterium]
MRSSVKEGLFLLIEDFARRRHRLVFLGTILVVGVCIFLGSRLTLDGDVLNLAPRNNRVVDTFRVALRDFGSLDYLLVLAEARPGQGVEDLEAFADLLAERLERLPAVRYVEHKIDTGGPFFSFFRKNQILFLPPGRLPELAAKFTDEAIDARVRENHRQLTGPSSFLMKQILTQDPFLISPLLVEAVLRNRGPLTLNLQGGYYLSKDGDALLLIVKPVKPAQDVAFDRELMGQVRRAAAEAARSFEEEGGPPDAGAGRDGPPPEELRAPEVSLGGGYVIALEESKLIRQDMSMSGPLSFIAIVLLYFFCYRRLGAILYSSVPLVVGQFLTLAVAYLFLRKLNSATTGFTAMLMGLGTDFTIVMYARYVEERVRGRSLPEALRLMMGASAFGVFTGAITSAGTFYAMCVTEYKGLRDFGFLVGSGILLCLVAILFLLPAMIAWNEGRARRTDVTRKLYLRSFGLQRLITWSTRRPVPVLAGSILVTLAAGYCAWNIQFSDSVQNLRSDRNRGLEVQRSIGRKFGMSFHPMMVIVRAPDAETLMRKNRAVSETLDRFKEEGALLAYDSISSYLPAREEQEAVIAALRQGAGGPFDTERIGRTFRAALERHGFRAGIYDEYIATLPATLRPSRPVTLSDLQEAGLERFVGRYISEGGEGGYRSVTYLFPADPKARRIVPPALVAALDRPQDGIEITGLNIVSAELRRIFKRDAWRAIIVGIALVTVLLWLDFRSVWLMALANIQVLTGVIWMLGVMRILGIRMNFVNAFVTTMILGVGIDYGIHIIHRISQEGLGNPAGLLETGKAVVMAALTNIAGFGAVAVSNYPGLRSMGIVCVIGSITCLATALMTMPALMTLTTRTRGTVRPRREDAARAV